MVFFFIHIHCISIHLFYITVTITTMAAAMSPYFLVRQSYTHSVLRFLRDLNAPAGMSLMRLNLRSLKQTNHN